MSMAFQYISIAILNALIWGFNSSIVKMGVQTVNPLMYTAWRYIFVWPLVFFMPRPQTSWKNIVLVSVATCSVTTLTTTVLYLGVGAGLASVVLQTQVFFTALVAFILWREKPTRNSWIGMTIAFLGVSCIALRMGTHVSYLGVFLMFLAALCWAFMNVAFRQVQKQVNLLHLIVWGSLIIPLPLMVLSTVFYGMESTLSNPLDFPPVTLISILYSGFISGLGGNICTGTLLKHYHATTVAPFMMLVPVSGLVFAYFILGETLTWLSASGCILVLVGLALNQWKQKEKAARTSIEIED